MQISGILIVFSPFFAFIPLVWLVFKSISRKEWVSKGSWSTGLLLMFIWSLIVGMINKQLLSLLSAFIYLIFYFVSLYLYNYYQTEDNVEKLLHYIFILTLGSACFGVLENLDIINHDPSWWKYLFGMTTLVENEENLFRITGTFSNPNLAASWYAVMILVGLYFYERIKGKEKLLFFSGVVLLTAALVMTGSRGGLIGLLSGLVIYDFFSGKKFQLIIRSLIFFTGLLFLLKFPEWFPRSDLLASTVGLRWAIWENCFNMFLKKPITGWGIMGIYFADNNVYQYLRVLHAHNTIISLAAMLGSVGLLIFAWMEWGLLKSIWQLFMKKCRLVPLLAGVQAIFIAHGVFDFTIMAPQIGLLFVAFSSFAGALSCSHEAEEWSVKGKCKGEYYI